MSYQSGKLQDPNQLAQNIISNIQKITHQTSEIQRIINQLGTPQDTTELRQQLQEKQQNVNHLAKETDRHLKEFGSLPVTTEQRQRKIQRDRLVKDFSDALAVFQRAQRQAAQKEKEFVARVRASSRVSGGVAEDAFYSGSPSPFQSEGHPQAQVQEDDITEDDLRLIQERENAIRQLESDITDINDIFKDLGMMVHEQGDMIDSIEANVESADVHVQSGTQQLARAADYQRKSRRKICILIVILVVVAVVIGLIIWGSIKK
ncbi:syntaxin-7 [Arapaima gigas]